MQLHLDELSEIKVSEGKEVLCCFAGFFWVFFLRSYKNILTAKAQQIELIGVCFLSKELKEI